MSEKTQRLRALYAEARRVILNNSQDRLQYTNTLRQISHIFYAQYPARFVLRADSVRDVLSKLKDPSNVYGCLDLDAGVEKPSEIIAMLDALEQPNSNIFEVILSRNDITAEYFERYVPLLEKSHMPIIAFDASNNRLGSTGAEVIAATMRAPWWRIEEFNVSANGFQAQDYLTITTAIPDRLYFLGIEDGGLDDQDVFDQVMDQLVNRTKLVHYEIISYSGNEELESFYCWEMAKERQSLYAFSGFGLPCDLLQIFADRKKRSPVVLFREPGETKQYHQATRNRLKSFFI